MKNFLIKTLLILMVIAIIASSCDEYPTPKIGQYKVQQNEPDKQYVGLVYLSIELNKLKSEITSTQTAIAIMPESASITKLKDGLTVINGKLDSIIATLYKIAGSGYANQLILEDLKAELSNLQTNITVENATLDNLVATIGSGNDALSARLNALVKDNNAIVVKISPVIEILDEISYDRDRDAATQLAIDVFNIQVAATKVSYQVLLATLLP